MRKPNKFYVYLLRDPWNRPCYVGQTFDPTRRGNEHGVRFYDEMTMEILCQCFTREQANNREKFYIGKFDTYHNGHNRNEGGDYYTSTEKTERERKQKKQATVDKAHATRQRNRTKHSPSQTSIFPDLEEHYKEDIR